MAYGIVDLLAVLLAEDLSLGLDLLLAARQVVSDGGGEAGGIVCELVSSCALV